jgi:hypothetical protein
LKERKLEQLQYEQQMKIKTEQQAQNSLHNKQILEQQLREKEMQKQEEYAQFLKEKTQVDQVLVQLEKEEQLKFSALESKKEESRLYVQQYLIERDRLLVEQAAKEQMVNNEIREWNKLQDERSLKLNAGKQLKMQDEQRKYEQVKQQIEETNMEQERMQELINELAIEEQELKLQEHDRIKEQQRLRMREEIHAENKTQLEYKRAKKLEEQAQEQRLREELLARYAQDAKLELISARNKRLAMIKYKKDVEDIIGERQQLRLREELIERQLNAQQVTIEEERKQIIERERIRLLKEHAPLLGKFLNLRIANNQQETQIIEQYLK